jgi:hypothetical protein
MPDEVTSTTEDLKAQFTEARLAGDQARVAELGPRIWPEPSPEEAMEQRGDVTRGAPNSRRRAWRASSGPTWRRAWVCWPRAPSSRR